MPRAATNRLDPRRGTCQKLRMALYWRVRSIPELRDLPERERERLWRRGYLYSLGRRRTKIALVAAIGLALTGYLAGRTWTTGVGALAGAALLFQVAVAEARPFWRRVREGDGTPEL